jgi:ferredoxin
LARIEADRERCIGSGLCAMAAETLFDQDAHDGRVLVLVEEVPAELTAAAREAVSLCPARALSLSKD